ncbi:hypothetical protein, partial [Bartonella sp. CE47NXGY]|uniref:hypothetical protein n=1 Tax=Bartonella sp. CE47NXGY TaxID=3243514 RepID=UPI0035D018E8
SGDALDKCNQEFDQIAGSPQVETPFGLQSHIIQKKRNKVNMLFAIILYESTQESIFLYVIHLIIFYIRLPCMNRP